MYYNVNNEARSCNQCCCRKAIENEGLYSFLSYPAGRSHLFCIVFVLSSICLAHPHLSTLSHKWHNFGRKLIVHKMYFPNFSTTFVTNILHSEKFTQQDNINVHWSSCKVAIIPVRF